MVKKKTIQTELIGLTKAAAAGDQPDHRMRRIIWMNAMVIQDLADDMIELYRRQSPQTEGRFMNTL